MRKVLLLLIAVTFITCSGSKEIVHKGNDNSEVVLNEIAEEKFEDHFTIIPNESKSHSLVLKKYKKLEDLIAHVHFFVFDNKKQEIIHSDELKSGTVKWISDIEVLAIARNIKTGDKPVVKYIFDISERKKKMLE